jgi:amino acid adenylation domain-containing protein
VSDFRLSPQQAFLLGRGPATEVSQVVLELDDGPASDELRARLEALVTRHEALRTTFVTPPGARAPVAQTIHDRLEPGWDTLSGGEDLLTDPVARETVLAGEAARVDPQHGPSIRALLVEPAGGGRALLLSALAASADSRSLALLGGELVAATAQPQGSDPIQHADYAEWRHELLTSEDPDAARGRSFWTSTVAEMHRETLLFGAREHRRGARATVAVRIDLDAHDRELLDRSDAGAELFVDAAWHALLARLTGATELLTCELVDGRSQADLEDAVGPYEQVTAIGLSIDADTRFVELVDRLGRVRADARRWLDYAVEADLGRLAEGAIAGFDALAGAPDSTVRFLSAGASGCPIELRWLGDGALELRYDAAVYDARDAEDIARQFKTLLGAALADPSQPVAALPLLDDAARAQILALVNGGQAAGGSDCVHHRFERQAADTPDLMALAGDGVAMTFRELNESANRLAHHLLDLGVERDQPVGLCMRRSPAMVNALLAIMKAGGGYVPINFAHPPSRIAHQLEEAGVGVLVTEAGLLEHLPTIAAVEVVCVDRDAEEIAQRPSENPPHRSYPEDLAYVIYTSGSTGLPKGVAVTHANLDNYTAAIAERLGASEGMQFAMVSEISTDLGNTAVFPPLVTGGCLHVIDNETAMDGSALAAYAAEHPIDVIKITPTHLRALLAADERVLPRRWLVVGGEALSWELAERVETSGAGCRVLNHYGPTEATVGCCTFEVRPGEPELPSATVPIGRPLPGARAYVLDAQLEPLPIGVAGELCVGGAGVARGYVNRPEETAARFVEDPQGGRVYRTGDRVRFLRDGSIEFLGRLDDQLKIRGYRVEPGEIETALARHPAIREAAVVPAGGGDGDPVLVAYFVAVSEPPLEELREFLAQSLPDYMLPSRWVPISAFPLTASGKVDRLALPDPDSVQTQRRVEFIAPRDEVETEIAAIWSSLLGVEDVGVLDDFFALGGHSLLATQAIMRIRRVYGEIPLGAMFNSPTVAALAEVIRARVSADTRATDAP